MSILKILPSAVDPTANYTFGRVISNGVDLSEAVAAAYNAANTVTPLDSFARQTANAAFLAANTKLSTSGGTITGNLIVNAITSNTITANGVDLGTAVASAFLLANSASRTTTSNTAPSGPNVGDMWFDTITSITFRYTNDGVSNNWIDISGPQNAGFIFQSYSLSSNTISLNETSSNTSVALTVSTINIADDTTLYWTISGSTGPDFTDGSNSGSVNITNNSGTIIRTLTADVTTEGAESFVAQLRTGSTSGPIVAIAPVITVADTSISPAGYLANILVVGGGGASRTGYSAGGGGGGFIGSANTLVVGTLYTVTVGAGGAPNAFSATGSNVGSLLVTGAGNLGGTTTGGQSGTPQMNSGGISTDGTPQGGTGGGGGAGNVGGNGFNGRAGNGGAGLSSSITGTNVGYCGGGGGCPQGTASDGGGRGAYATGWPNSFGESGQTNTGGGAGGSDVSSIGRPGGSGVVVFSWPTGGLSSTGIPINPTLSGTYTQTTSGGNTIVQFTGSGTFTA